MHHQLDLGTYKIKPVGENWKNIQPTHLKSMQDNKTHLEGLQNKVNTLEKDKETLTKENGDLKAKYYDLWASQPRTDNTIQEETKEEPVKSLEDLLMEE